MAVFALIEDVAENAISIIYFEKTAAFKNWLKCITTQ